ncbi:RING finger protein ETP1-like protein [Zancudomyces culisetae]|uniref:RING finger protein ETP1-like protein n=1 Tax=Zancudomyces culisetae TaxID=1213189 RepID=A0A1R1PGW3_ZANCU|nr:RING finger protein ETP1-like protein [Zancudomyces culisetae]|eukprot:OMH80177.1 RING finger protein ETP1-like protein [Zancudomyces culisetae]
MYISEFKVIKTESWGNYIIIIKFAENEDVVTSTAQGDEGKRDKVDGTCGVKEIMSEFYEHYNGKSYSPFEPEKCRIVYIDQVRMNKRMISGSDESKTEKKIKIFKTDEDLRTEMPSCPVCLERLDSNSTGLLTIMCQHTFHSNCLSGWKENSCPVCRQVQQMFINQNGNRNDADGNAPQQEWQERRLENIKCMECDSNISLWICVICGVVGCGRYKGGHMHKHYLETNHIYAMELETQRVWDYAGDGYVHRIMQNKSDGKLVMLELPNFSNSGNYVSMTGGRFGVTNDRTTDDIDQYNDDSNFNGSGGGHFNSQAFHNDSTLDVNHRTSNVCENGVTSTSTGANGSLFTDGDRYYVRNNSASNYSSSKGAEYNGYACTCTNDEKELVLHYHGRNNNDKELKIRQDQDPVRNENSGSCYSSSGFECTTGHPVECQWWG